jgi:hypothetical protein
LAACFSALTLLPWWHVLSVERHGDCCHAAAEAEGASRSRPLLLDAEADGSCWVCDNLTSLSQPESPAVLEAGKSCLVPSEYSAHAPQALAHHIVDRANRSQAPPPCAV